jgi:hypothetical protein
MAETLEDLGFKPLGPSPAAAEAQPEPLESPESPLESEGFKPVGQAAGPNKTTTLGQIGAGLMDPIYGAAQVTAHGLSDPPAFPSDEPPNQAASYADKFIREREAGITAERGSDAEKMDWSRALGSMLNPLNYVGNLVGGGPIVKGVTGGGFSGLIEPTVTKEGAGESDYLSAKAGQVGLGGAVGGTIGILGKGASLATQKVGEFLARNYPEALENKAVQIILKRFAQDEKYGGSKAKDAIKLVNEANKAGKPQVLADKNISGTNVQKLAGNVARAPGESSALAGRALNKRDQTAFARLEQDIADHVNSGPSAHRMTEALLHTRSQGAKPLYDAVDSLEHIWSPRLDEFLKSPRIKQGLAHGWRLEAEDALAENRPLSTTTLGIDLDIDGNVKLLDKPNMRLLDMAKRGMDKMIADERDNLTGRLSTDGRSIDKVRRAFIDEIESLDKKGIYKKAREFWSGKSASLDAVAFGKSLLGSDLTREEITDQLAKFTANDREFVRIGLADDLRRKLGKAGLDSDESKRLINSNNWVNGWLKPVFKSEQDYNEFLKDVLDERAMFESKAAMLGGAATQGRLAEEAYGAAQARQLKGWGYVARNAIRRPVGSAIDAWRLYNEIGMPRSEKLNEAIAKILFSERIPARSNVGRKLRGTLPTNAPSALPNAPGRISGAAPFFGTAAAQMRPPQENPQDGNQIPSFAQGGIVTKPTVAMVGEKGPEAIVPLAKQQGQNFLSGLEGQIGAAKQRQQSVLSGLENKFGGMEQGFMGWLEGLLSRSPQGQQLLQNLQQRGIPGFAEGGVVTEPTIATLGEKGPEAVIPLDNSAAAQPTNFLADASPQDQAMQAREVATQRMQRGVQPGGTDRSQWPPSPQLQQGAESFLDVAAPGYSAAKAAGRGEYGEAAMEAGMAAAPFGAGKIASAFSGPIGKAVAASTAALYTMFTDTATGRSNLSPEAQEKLRFMQEKSKLEQKQRTEEAARRKQEADEKAARDVQAAQQAAQTQADLQARLAQIEADKQKEQLRIEQERQESERRAAEETVRANAAENKRLAERPFRERHPDAALNLTLGGIAVAALIPGASEAYKKWAYNSYIREWEKLDKIAADALLKGTPAEQQLAVNRLSAAAAKKAEQEGKLHQFPWLTQLGSAGAAVEGGLVPSEVDITQPKESEAHKAAVEFFTSPSEWGRLGALYAGGTLAGLTSKEAAGALIPTRKTPSGAEGAIKTYEQQEAARKKAATAAKSAATRAAKKEKEAAKKEEPRKAKVPREGTKIYGLREE